LGKQESAMNLNKAEFAVLIVLCIAPAMAAQQPVNPQHTDSEAPDPVIRESFQFVLVPVTVTDKDGNVADGLTPYDFRLTNNGKPQKITAEIASHPLSMVVAIQSSRDVEKILPSIKKLSSVFESLVLGDNAEIAILAFDDRITTLTDFTSEPPKIDAGFKKLSPGSYTSDLNDAAMAGINMLRNRPSTRRRVLVLMSENRDKGSGIKVSEVLTAAEFANVAIYSVNMSQLIASLTSEGQANRPNPIPPEARALPAGVIGTPTTDRQMEMGNWVPAFKAMFFAVKHIFAAEPLDIYSKYTGGRQYSFKTQKTLEEDISRLGEELHSQYFLTYLSSNGSEAGFHRIVVTVLKPNLQVRTRDGYWLAAKPE
jgi:VWFA-related protein